MERKCTSHGATASYRAIRCMARPYVFPKPPKPKTERERGRVEPQTEKGAQPLRAAIRSVQLSVVSCTSKGAEAERDRGQGQGCRGRLEPEAEASPGENYLDLGSGCTRVQRPETKTTRESRIDAHSRGVARAPLAAQN